MTRRGIRRWLRLPRSPDRIRSEVDAELAFDIDMRTRDLVADGLSPEDAHARAVAEFGDLEATRRYCEELDMQIEADARRADLIGDLRADVMYAVRTLRKSPAFLATTVLTLALGIGANLATFTVVNAVLLQPLPFHDPDRLVRVYDDLTGAGAKDVGMSVPELQDLSDSAGVFEQMSVILPASTALSGGDKVERIELLGTSPDYFELLGAKAALGRVYGQAEWVPGFLDGVVISDALWRRQFGADPNVLGRRIRVDEDAYTIIGVMPGGFRHPGNTVSGDVDLWAATGFSGAPFPSPPVRSARFLPGAIARLKPGVTIAQAKRRLDVMVANLERAYPNDYPARLRWSLRVEPVQTTLTSGVRPTLVILLVAVGVVLLIVCVNVASLLLARASTRAREFAIRQALGASRGRMVRQMLAESALLSGAGGAVALVVLWLAERSLLAVVPAGIPRLTEVRADWRLVMGALALALGTGVLFGLAPALQASAVDPNRGLKEGGRTAGQSRGHRRARTTLVVAEIALSVMLMIGAGLLVRSFAAALHQDPGFDPERLVVGQVWVPVPNDPKLNHYQTTAQLAELTRKMLAQFSTLPGVEDVAVGSSSDIPMLPNVGNITAFSLPDEPTTQDLDHAAEYGTVSPNYFATLRTPVIAGRVFTDHDDATASNVMVVNEAFARRFASGGTIVGQRFRGTRGTEFRIIGVVGDVRDDGLDVLPAPRVYASILQRSAINLAVFLRTTATQNDAATKERIAPTMRSIDPELPAFGVQTMGEVMSTSMARRRFSLVLMSTFALSALLLAALGIYGVMAFVVSQRAQEFGVRIALGAEPRDIVALVIRPGLLMAGAGTLIGVGASLGATRLMRTLVFGVSTGDPSTFVAVPVLLAAAALLACLVPARRAIRVSPLRALKE